ncbi:hypothetical protein LUZ60_017175 [Juncus effusus]|nr:hypothetical protein LUZ60_017175 [Juncus effusus]
MDKNFTSNRFSCCLSRSGGVADESDDWTILLIRLSTWLKEQAQHLPEFGERCCGLVDRIRWRRGPACDFRYDPLSYAKNFDQGLDLDEYDVDDAAQGDTFRYRNFSSRLPPSPSTQLAVVVA